MDIEEIQRLKQENNLDEAREAILKLLEDYEDDAKVLLEAGLIHDRSEMPPQAILYYEKALEAGLENEDRKNALLALGSSYRAVGLYDQAKETLEIGMSEFPASQEFYIFFAMVLYNLDEADLAMEILLTKLVELTEDEGIMNYKKAISFYASRLDETFG